MINAWWLLLIIPASAGFGFFIGALMAANEDDFSTDWFWRNKDD